MVKIVKDTKVSHGCYGELEREEIYIVIKGEKIIATFSYDPSDFLKELCVKFKAVR